MKLSAPIEKQMSYHYRSDYYRARLKSQLVDIMDQVTPSYSFGQLPGMERFRDIRFSRISRDNLYHLLIDGYGYENRDYISEKKLEHKLFTLASIAIYLRNNLGFNLNVDLLDNITCQYPRACFLKSGGLVNEFDDYLINALSPIYCDLSYRKAFLLGAKRLYYYISERDCSIRKLLNKHSRSIAGIQALVEINKEISFIPALELISLIEANGFEKPQYIHLFDLAERGELLDFSMGL